MNDFLKELGEKLKVAGLPLLENDLEVLYKVLSAHLKGFKFEQELVSALVPVFITALDSVVLKEINKIDGNPA